MASSSYTQEGNKTFISTNAPGSYAGLCVKIDGSNPGQVVLAAAATDPIIGTVSSALSNNAGDYVDVRLRSASGSAVGVAGGTITAGARLTSNSSGQLIATTTAGDEIVGIALFAAASGQVFEFMPYTGKY